MKCKFCQEKEAETQILDGETLETIPVCIECYEKIREI